MLNEATVNAKGRLGSLRGAKLHSGLHLPFAQDVLPS